MSNRFKSLLIDNSKNNIFKNDNCFKKRGMDFKSKPENKFIIKKRENKLLNEIKRQEENNSLFSIINRKIEFQEKKNNKYIPKKIAKNTNKFIKNEPIRENKFKKIISNKPKKIDKNTFDDNDFPPLN